MNYRLAEKKDIDSICYIIAAAIDEMGKNGIYQWDEVYPAKSDFFDDIEKGILYVGEMDGKIAVIYAINKEYDEQYNNGKWKYLDSEYRIIHRLCVNPLFQNKGVAKQTLSFVEKELKGEGVETIRLDFFSENPFALSLYQKNGYEEVGIANWRKGKFYLMEKHL